MTCCTSHFNFMQTHFQSWQDIIPVITGNERLWHSHKINAQWQNLCSKASTASFVKAHPTLPLPCLKGPILKKKKKVITIRRMSFATPMLTPWVFWVRKNILQSNRVRVETIYQCCDSADSNWLLFNASANAFICIHYKLLLAPETPQQVKL